MAGETEARANANAAFIVTACNSYASTRAENKALREALESIANGCETATDDGLTYAVESWGATARAALSLGGAQ